MFEFDKEIIHRFRYIKLSYTCIHPYISTINNKIKYQLYLEHKFEIPIHEFCIGKKMKYRLNLEIKKKENKTNNEKEVK